MFKLLAILLCVSALSGCVVTKVVTVPMRVGGAVISVVPVVGGVAESVIDTTADVIDIVPL